jgi:hypothetical protein
MSETDTSDMFGSSTESEHPKTFYLLTSPRQLLRILDIGLVVPELVATGAQESRFFTVEELGGLAGIDGYPKVPVIIELNSTEVGAPAKAVPAHDITAIHFFSEEDKTDFTIRVYENVPTGLFNLVASSSLFMQSDIKLEGVSLGKLKKVVLAQNYRHLDVEAGLLYGYIEEAMNAESVTSLLTDYAKADSTAVSLNTLSQALATTGDELSRQITEAYLSILCRRNLDEGWVGKVVLTELTDLFSKDHSELSEFLTWQEYCSEVLNGTREMAQLTDEKHIILRAILLHLLNPDAESIERICAREPAPGPRVQQAAMILASARTGFAPMVAAKKEANPGAYFLLSELMAAKINESLIDMTPLLVERVGDIVKILWRGQQVQSIQIQASQESEASGNVTPAFSDVAAAVTSLPNVLTAKVADDALSIVLDKKYSKLVGKLGALKIIPCAPPGTDLLLSTQLLDFTVKSHKARLNGPRALDAIRFQSEHRGSGFQFYYEEEVGFFAQIVLRQEQCLNRQALSPAIDLMIKSNEWMKSSGKK